MARETLETAALLGEEFALTLMIFADDSQEGIGRLLDERSWSKREGNDAVGSPPRKETQWPRF